MDKAFISWSRVFCALVLTAGLFLAACGSETVTVSPTTASTTTPAETTAAATTTIAVTTATTTAALTTAPNTAAVTTAPISTTATATTGAAITTGQTSTSSSKAIELLANFPDTADNLKEIKYNNYAALRKLYNIQDNATLETITADKDTFTKFNNSTGSYDFSALFPNNYLQLSRSTAGFDFFQADYDAQAGTVPNYLSIAQGNFNFSAIDNLWTQAEAVKGMVGNYSSYTLERTNLNQQLQRIFIGPLSLVVMPDKKTLLLSKPPQTGMAAAANLPSKMPITNNPQVKALLDSFGDALSIHMGTMFISVGDPIRALTPGVAPATSKADEPLPVPSMVGYGYNEDSLQARSYLVANYYPSEANAKAAQPILENSLKNGTSLQSRIPYNKYFEVVSTEIKGNLLLIKLNMTTVVSLNRFIAARDFPPFNVN